LVTIFSATFGPGLGGVHWFRHPRDRGARREDVIGGVPRPGGNTAGRRYRRAARRGGAPVAPRNWLIRIEFSTSEKHPIAFGIRFRCRLRQLGVRCLARDVE
jgi:hypothetical protein